MKRLLGIALGFVVMGSWGCKRPSPIPTFRRIELNIPKTEGTSESNRVVVVCNINSPESIEVTEYYCARRNIPPSHVVQVSTTISEVVTWSDYRWNIRTPIRDHIKGLNERIDFVVMTKGIPLRIHDNVGPSVDSMVAGMDLDRATIDYVARDGLNDIDPELLRNPYYDSSEKFASDKFGIYLVTRLDGYDVADVKRMIQRGLKAKAERGTFVFDQAADRSKGGYKPLNDELVSTAEALTSRGFKAYVDRTAHFLLPTRPVMGYVSWGSNDGKFKQSKYERIRFLNGAISETFVSTSGRTMLPPDSGQSVITDLVHQGVTGVKGYVSEPFTPALARPAILFDRYTRGFNLAESFYAASPMILWKDIVLGDPLVNPFGGEDLKLPFE